MGIAWGIFGTGLGKEGWSWNEGNSIYIRLKSHDNWGFVNEFVFLIVEDVLEVSQAE